MAEFADFYAVAPPDNAETVAPGADVSFPNTAATGGTSILRAGDSQFTLVEQGTYLVFFSVQVTEAGQLVLTLGDAELSYTVAGRATGTSPIEGFAVVQTPGDNITLTLRNPACAATALTITQNAGGTEAVSSHLTILRLS